RPGMRRKAERRIQGPDFKVKNRGNRFKPSAFASGKLEFGGPSNFRSLRTSPQTGVAISRIDVPLFVDEFQKTVQKNGLYDDR
ncbi:MAG: hypothetical protein ACI4P4_06540, partial [Faecousia sp.]